MSSSAPNMNRIVMRSNINHIINQLRNSQHPIRILIHGPRKGGKTSALRVIEQKASSLSYRIIIGDSLFSRKFQDANDLLILFDDLDNDPEGLNELINYPQASVIATAQGRYRLAKGAWENWTCVRLDPFNSAELADLTTNIDKVLKLSCGHPFFVMIALDWLSERGNKQTLINKIDQYMAPLSRIEKLILTLIAIASGDINPSNRRQQRQAPLTVDALMVTYDAQDWFSTLRPEPNRINPLHLLEVLDRLDDEGVITYDRMSGWQIMPLIVEYYRHQGWSGVIENLMLNDYFQR